MEKKQKMLLALLAVAGIGAGSYFYLTGEAANEAPTVTSGPAARKERKVTESAKTNTRKERTEKTAEAPPPPTRKERVERTEESAGRKSRTKGPTEVKKAKKIVPAA